MKIPQSNRDNYIVEGQSRLTKGDSLEICKNSNANMTEIGMTQNYNDRAGVHSDSGGDPQTTATS